MVRPRYRREENERRKAGETPAGWQEQPHKLAQKDTDARWTKQNGQSYYGHQHHVQIDAGSKLLESHHVTVASVPDSQQFAALVSEGDGDVWADSAHSAPNPVKKTRRRASNRRSARQRGI